MVLIGIIYLFNYICHLGGEGVRDRATLHLHELYENEKLPFRQRSLKWMIAEFPYFCELLPILWFSKQPLYFVSWYFISVFGGESCPVFLELSERSSHWIFLMLLLVLMGQWRMLRMWGPWRRDITGCWRMLMHLLGWWLICGSLLTDRGWGGWRRLFGNRSWLFLFLFLFLIRIIIEDRQFSFDIGINVDGRGFDSILSQCNTSQNFLHIIVVEGAFSYNYWLFLQVSFKLVKIFFCTLGCKPENLRREIACPTAIVFFPSGSKNGTLLWKNLHNYPIVRLFFFAEFYGGFLFDALAEKIKGHAFLRYRWI